MLGSLPELPTGILAALFFLLPGFLAAAVFHEFTPHPKSGQFERTVQALIFTVVVQALTLGSIHLGLPEHWLIPYAIAVLFGITLAGTFNHDLLHRLFRKVKLTRETPDPSNWCSAFARHRCNVILHLEGTEEQRRVHGWPEEWPSSPDKDFFCLANAQWLDPDGSVVAQGAPTTLIAAEEVVLVEFMEEPQR